MDYQLIIAKKDFYIGLLLSPAEKEKYIFDYIELSSMHLRRMKSFNYRLTAVKHPLQGGALRRAFDYSMKNGRNRSSFCYCIDDGEFVLNMTDTASKIRSELSDYIGVLYRNH